MVGLDVYRLLGGVVSVIPIGLAVTYGFPVFIPLFVLVSSLLLLNKSLYKISINVEILIYAVLVISIHLLGGILSDRLYGVYINDVKNIIFFVGCIFVVAAIVDMGGWERFKDSFAWCCVVALVPLSLFGLYKFYMMLNGVEVGVIVNVPQGRSYPWGTSLKPDYNMTAMAYSIAVLCVFHLRDRVTGFRRGVLIVSLIPLVVAAMLTGSRRMYVVFGFISMLILVRFIFRVAKVGSVLRWVYTGKIDRSVIHKSIAVVIFIGVLVYGWGGGGELIPSSRTAADEFGKLYIRLETLVGVSNVIETSGRGERWEQAFRIIDGYSLSEILFGSGFDYVGIMGASVFSGEDYPHNPLISALLYGGVLGFFVVSWVLVRTAYLYIVNFRKEKLFASLFFLSVAFLFISGNSILSFDIFILLSVIPYYFR